jgi:hypothetical protein
LEGLFAGGGELGPVPAGSEVDFEGTADTRVVVDD